MLVHSAVPEQGRQRQAALCETLVYTVSSSHPGPGRETLSPVQDEQKGEGCTEG